MSLNSQLPQAAFPRAWPACVKSGLLQAISLAHLAIIQARGWAANSLNARVRLAAQLERAKSEIAMLREEIRIKDTPMRVIPTQQRPHAQRVGAEDQGDVVTWPVGVAGFGPSAPPRRARCLRAQAVHSGRESLRTR
ncbi:MAG TPA: hypothetical protein PLP01_14275, partial [Phycisphaerae bacterium]|nr:hypothetical protein [Phycisphaerae bacterium]